MGDGVFKINDGKHLIGTTGKRKICGCCDNPTCCQVGDCCFVLPDGTLWYPDVTLFTGTRFKTGLYAYTIEFYSDAAGTNLVEKHEFTIAPDAGYENWFTISPYCDSTAMAFFNRGSDGTHNLNGHLKITTYPGPNVVYDGTYSAILGLAYAASNSWHAMMNGYTVVVSLGASFVVSGDCRSVVAGNYASSIVFNGASYERHFLTLNGSSSNWTNTNCCRDGDGNCGTGEAGGDGACL